MKASPNAETIILFVKGEGERVALAFIRRYFSLLRHIIADIEPYVDHVRKISLICIIEISASGTNSCFGSV